MLILEHQSTLIIRFECVITVLKNVCQNTKDDTYCTIHRCYVISTNVPWYLQGISINVNIYIIIMVLFVIKYTLL